MNLSIIGAGTVGQATAKLVGEYGHNVVAMSDSTGSVVDPAGLDIAEVVTRKREIGSVGQRPKEDALAAPYDVLVETTPTTLGDAHPAMAHIETALRRGCDVVLANKGPVAERYRDVKSLEARYGRSIRFGPTVSAATPVIATVKTLDPAEVVSLKGVLNGTTNFILSEMDNRNIYYKNALGRAKRRGLAEEDPNFDVEGIDTAVKCAILANVLYGGGFSASDVDTSGITSLTPEALSRAKNRGETIRLVGEIDPTKLTVEPRAISVDSPLAVSGVNNALRVETRHAGTFSVRGRGAGARETAQALLREINIFD